MNNIAIFGGTGFIGKNIIASLIEKSYYVNLFTTNSKKAESIFRKSGVKIIHFPESNPEKLAELISSSKIIINLAGTSIGAKRWTNSFKTELTNSRINFTKQLINSLALIPNKIELFINASAVGYYGDTKNKIITEVNDSGNDFLANLCKNWEEEAFKAKKYVSRVICTRLGIVLDKQEGALRKLLNPYRFRIGNFIAPGDQWISWIYIKDLIEIFNYIIDNTNLHGAINCTSPNPVTNKEFNNFLSDEMKSLFKLRMPGFILQLLIGEFAKTIITGQKVIPRVLLNSGFNFKFDKLDLVLNQILSDDK